MEKLIMGLFAVVGVFVLGLVLCLLTGFVTWLCWNSVMVGYFHLAHIGFWQAVVLTILCHTLFKSTSTSSKS